MSQELHVEFFLQVVINNAWPYPQPITLNYTHLYAMFGTMCQEVDITSQLICKKENT